MDRAQLADFLRARRAALQPEDVGLTRGPRRRTSGLRREEAAALSGMSVDYWGRLEQGRGPQPSTQMLTAIARALRLGLAERDHLFRLAGHGTPDRSPVSDHVAPGILRILDRLHDTPAEVLSATGETLVQTPAGVALMGERTGFTGLGRATVYRWWTDPASRDLYPPEDHEERGRAFTAELRAAVAAQGPRSRAAEIAAALERESPEFRAEWAAHRVAEKHPTTKTIRHPELGDLVLDCETLLDTDTGQVLLVFTAPPGTPEAEKLALLSVLGGQRIGAVGRSDPLIRDARRSGADSATR